MSEDGSDWDSDKSCRTPDSDRFATSQRRPTYTGYIKTPADAILLLAACDQPETVVNSRIGPLPRRISRRLLDDERSALIHSGAIFVWDEREAGMRRWTDGRCWSASRVSGCFLTYRELEMRKKTKDNAKDGPRMNLYKAEGLVKQSFSITTASQRKLHVISYFSKNDVRLGRLQRVSQDPRIVGSGPNSWGVRVDESEYGELLGRDSEEFPSHMIVETDSTKMESSTGGLLSHSSGVKRSTQEMSPACSPMYFSAQELHAPPAAVGHGPMRPKLGYSMAHSHYFCDRSYVSGEMTANKRYRYDPRAPLGNAPAYYGASRGWSSQTDLPPREPCSSTPPPVTDTGRMQLPPIRSAPSAELERGAMVALASLRGQGPPPHPVDMPNLRSLAPAPSMSAARHRPRAAVLPISTADRDSLGKLSVPL